MLRAKNIIRILNYPLAILNELHRLGKKGSRDLFNKTRFKDVIIDQGVCINDDSSIKPYSHIYENSIINDSIIESYTYLGKNCVVQNTKIGKYCSIANDVLIGLGQHPLYYFSTATLFYKKINALNINFVEKDLDFIENKSISIGNDVWIGARAVILNGVSIGDGAIIAANAVVTKDVPPYAIVAGVPSKIIKYRFTNEKIQRLIESNWWNWQLHVIKNKMNELNS